MRNTAGEKVRNIINEEFDGRMEIAVVTYILDKGFENLKEISEEEILKVKGNGLMTDRFCQTLVRAAVRICKECNEIDDFLPFIINYLYVPKARMKELEVYSSEMLPSQWEEFLDKFNVDYEEADKVDMVVLNANVIETFEAEREE